MRRMEWQNVARDLQQHTQARCKFFNRPIQTTLGETETVTAFVVKDLRNDGPLLEASVDPNFISSGEEYAHLVESEVYTVDSKIPTPADLTTIDLLGGPQHIPEPLLVTVIALIGVVAVARRKTL